MSWSEPPEEAPFDSSVDSWLKQSLEGQEGAPERVVRVAMSPRPVVLRQWPRRIATGFALVFLLSTLGLALVLAGFRQPDVWKDQPAKTQVEQPSGFPSELRGQESFLIDNRGDVVTITAASGQVRAIVMGRNP